MRTEIQDPFVIKSPPTDVPVISYVGFLKEEEEKEDGEIQNFFAMRRHERTLSTSNSPRRIRHQQSKQTVYLYRT